MPLRIFTLVYGKHLDWFKRSSASIGWNREALEGALWRIYTDDEACVREILKTDLELSFEAVRPSVGTGAGLLQAMIQELETCVQEESAFLAAPPDMIFGAGTIQTMRKIASEGKYLCVTVPHPRVVADTFPELETTSNARLVKLAIEHMHPAWQVSNIDLPENAAYPTGVAWRPVGKNLDAVSARVPTPHLVQAKLADIEFLKSKGPGAWDHLWPEELVKEQRQRIIGSSDAAFMVELTPRNRHMAHCYRRLAQEPDKYKLNLEHHKVNRNTVTIWRAE